MRGLGYHLQRPWLLDCRWLSTRSGTVSEIVLDGTTGFVVEKNNVDELAGALRTPACR